MQPLRPSTWRDIAAELQLDPGWGYIVWFQESPTEPRRIVFLVRETSACIQTAPVDNQSTVGGVPILTLDGVLVVLANVILGGNTPQQRVYPAFLNPCDLTFGRPCIELLATAETVDVAMIGDTLEVERRFTLPNITPHMFRDALQRAVGLPEPTASEFRAAVDTVLASDPNSWRFRTAPHG